jgi:integrase
MPCKEGKTWRGIVYVGKAKVKQKRGFRTKREALAWESREKKEILRSQRVSQGITLQSFCIDYLDYSLRFSEKTYQEKRILCKQILKAWGSDCPVGSITPKMVLSFLQSRAAETSGHAYNKAHKNLRAMWRWGQKILQLSENPVAEIDPMPWDSTPHEMPSLESVVRILMAATREERVFLNAYLMTGARRSEILRWRWDLDINFQGRAYRLGTRKTRDGSMKYEWFPMPDELYEELWWWYQNRPVKGPSQNNLTIFCVHAIQDAWTRKKL